MINLNRQYISRWCPLNSTLVSEYLEAENLTDDELITNIPNVIFDLPPFSYALITVDFRHILEEDYYWTYGEDYQISFTLAEGLGLEDDANPIPMPEQFLSNLTSKTGVHVFEVFSWQPQ
jgi:hypothetical protein